MITVRAITDFNHFEPGQDMLPVSKGYSLTLPDGEAKALIKRKWAVSA